MNACQNTTDTQADRTWCMVLEKEAYIVIHAAKALQEHSIANVQVLGAATGGVSSSEMLII